MQNIPQEGIRKYSGKPPAINRVVEALKRRNYYVTPRPIMGDAPKNFIYVYEFGNDKCIRNDTKTWIPYIAKVGHKWYPIESITEYLLNRIGEILNLGMAKSRLAIINGQLRFLSRFFLNDNEQLIHGAEIFSNYLRDPEMVEQIGIRKEEQSWFTFQFVEASIRSNFPEQGDNFMESFVKLLIFDALTGNNDRHHFNWGIITEVMEDKGKTRFSPIYDTARGLFWSTSDAQIDVWSKNPQQVVSQIRKYAEGAKPQTGWDSAGNINHFQLIELLAKEARFTPFIAKMRQQSNADKIFRLIDTDFICLMTPQRRHLIKKYIQTRFERLQNISLD